MTCLNLIGNHFNIANIENIMTRICGRNWIPVQMLAICLFYIFKDAKVRNSGVINTLARGSLGVYVIHENMLFRYVEDNSSILWNKLLRVDEYFSKPDFVFVFILSVIAVYLLCSFIEFIRWKLEQNVMLKSRLIMKLFGVIDKFSI